MNKGETLSVFKHFTLNRFAKLQLVSSIKCLPRQLSGF